MEFKDHFWGMSSLQAEEYLPTPTAATPPTPGQGEETRMRGFETLTRRHRDSKRVLKHLVGFLSDVAAAEDAYGRALAKAVTRASLDVHVEYPSLRAALEGLLKLVLASAERASEVAQTLAHDVLGPARAFKEYFKGEPKEAVRVEAKLHRELASLRASLPKLREKYHAKSAHDEELQAETVEIVNSSVLTSAEVMRLTEKQVKAVKDANAAKAAYAKAVHATEALVDKYNAHVESSCSLFQALERERHVFVEDKLAHINALLTDPVPPLSSAKDVLSASVAAINTDNDLVSFVSTYRTSSDREAPPVFDPFHSTFDESPPPPSDPNASGRDSETTSPTKTSNAAVGTTVPGIAVVGVGVGVGAAAAASAGVATMAASSSSTKHSGHEGLEDHHHQSKGHLDGDSKDGEEASLLSSRSQSHDGIAGGTAGSQPQSSSLPFLLPATFRSHAQQESGTSESSGPAARPVSMLNLSASESSSLAPPSGKEGGSRRQRPVSERISTSRSSSLYVSDAPAGLDNLSVLPPFPPPPASHHLRRSLVNYQAHDSEELSLFVDDYIEVVGVLNGDWWLGKVGNETGLFYAPATVVIDTLLFHAL